MEKKEFITKEKGLYIVRLSPESFFGRKFDKTEDYFYRLGYAHGLLLQKEIQEMAEYLPKFLKETRGKLLGKIAYQFLLMKARKMKKFIPKEYLIEMLGVADGAGVDFDFIFLINVFDELKNVYGCSALATEESGRLLYGVNTDYAVFGDFLGPRNTVFIYRQKPPMHNFVSVAWPGYVGLIRGMNEKGMVLISLASYSHDQTIKGIPTSFLYRKIIEKFDSDFVLPTAKRTIGNNILIGNKQNAIIIEVSANHWDARGLEELSNKKLITTTNHYQTAMSQYQRPPKPAKGMTIPKEQEEKWFWNFFDLEGSKTRNETLKRTIKNYLEYFKAHPNEKFTPEIIQKILARVANPYTTLNSMIFDPANLELYIANNQGKMPATDGKLVKINVGNLFKL